MSVDNPIDHNLLPEPNKLVLNLDKEDEIGPDDIEIVSVENSAPVKLDLDPDIVLFRPSDEEYELSDNVSDQDISKFKQIDKELEALYLTLLQPVMLEMAYDNQNAMTFVQDESFSSLPEQSKFISKSEILLKVNHEEEVIVLNEGLRAKVNYLKSQRNITDQQNLLPAPVTFGETFSERRKEKKLLNEEIIQEILSDPFSKMTPGVEVYKPTDEDLDLLKTELTEDQKKELQKLKLDFQLRCDNIIQPVKIGLLKAKASKDKMSYYVYADLYFNQYKIIEAETLKKEVEYRKSKVKTA